MFVRIVNQINGSQITRGRRRPKKIIRKIMKKDIEINYGVTAI
jgi:hypothetical protein